MQQMHGNLTQRSATNWDHYMDYKACFLFDDFKLIFQQLNRDAVPYFLVPHAGFFGVHIDTGAWRHCGRGDLSHHIQR